MTRAVLTRIALVALAVCFGFTFLALIQTPSDISSHQGSEVQFQIQPNLQNPSNLRTLLGPSVNRRLRYVKWRRYGDAKEVNSTGRGYLAAMGGNQPFLSSIPISFQEQVLSGLQLSCHPGPEGLFRPQYSRFLHILQEYVDLHHSMKQSKISRTLTWHCPAQEYCGGLGDRIRGVTYALLLAIFSRRRLVVFWDGVPEGAYLYPHMIDWRDSRTYEFLHNVAAAKKKIPTSYEAPEMFSFKVILRHGKVVNDVSSSGMSYYQRIISSNTTNIIISTNMEPSSLLHSERNGDQNWIRSGLEWTGLSHLHPDVLDDLVGICFRYLFKLRKDVLDEVASAQHVLGLSGPYTALHIRTGFASMDHHEELQRHPKLTQNVSEWQASIHCAIKTANKVLGNSSVVYLATDSDMVKEMALEKYPQRVRMLKNSLIHVDLLRKGRQERELSREEEQEGVIVVWTELLLLAQAKVLLRDAAAGILLNQTSLNEQMELPVTHVRWVRSRGGVTVGGIPWTCPGEWEELYSWLYSSNPALVKKGVGRVSAWKARGEVPMMVEVTADLCECRVHERGKEKGAAQLQALALQYSMAITRFVNGIADIAKDRLKFSANLLTCVDKYGIPAWIVTLRHRGTHEKLPSVGAFRAGAEFCLSWLRANYWRPQRLTIGDMQGGTTRTSPIPDERGAEFMGGSCGRRGGGGEGEGHISKLTKGLCQSRPQLLELLIQSDYHDLSEYLQQRQLLQFPPSIKYSIKAPELSDLDGLPSLRVGEGDLGVWRTHLLKAAKASSSMKVRLLSALLHAVHSPNCDSSHRDFLCGWLDMLFQCEQQNQHHAQVHFISSSGREFEDTESFMPGEVDWMGLLQVLKHHPGYYSLAIMKVICEHVKSSMDESVLSKALQLTKLVTLSSRLGTSPEHSTTASREASQLTRPHLLDDVIMQQPTYEKASINALKEELENLKSSWGRRLDQAVETDGEMMSTGCGMERDEHERARWKHVEDAEAWARCCLGVCPGQEVAVGMFDLFPSHIDKEATEPVSSPEPLAGPSGEHSLQLSGTRTMEEVKEARVGRKASSSSDCEIVRVETQPFSRHQLDNLKKQVKLLL